jgi:hypothetical protein
MTFKDWLAERQLSDASIRKYESSISGVMSTWAQENGLLDKPLTSIRNYRHFQSITADLKALPIYQARNTRGKNMYGSALSKYAEFLSEQPDNAIETDIDSILSDTLLETEKSTLIKTRIGQEKYRQQLIAYWQGCAVTGYKDTGLLIASHIKPWRVATQKERLDSFNGLLLLPNIDRAFDTGLVTFEHSGKIKLSSLLSSPETLGINNSMSVNLQIQHQGYMDFHREKVFFT